MLFVRPAQSGTVGLRPRAARPGNDLGFITLVIYGCSALCVATLLFSLLIGEGIDMRSVFSFFGPGTQSLLSFGASGSCPGV